MAAVNFRLPAPALLLVSGNTAVLTPLQCALPSNPFLPQLLVSRLLSAHVRAEGSDPKALLARLALLYIFLCPFHSVP